MKALGITRKIDDLGRVVIPKELRTTSHMGVGDALEFFVDGEDIILRKFQTKCSFCEEKENLEDFKGKKICSACHKNIRKL